MEIHVACNELGKSVDFVRNLQGICKERSSFLFERECEGYKRCANRKCIFVAEFESTAELKFKSCSMFYWLSLPGQNSRY